MIDSTRDRSNPASSTAGVRPMTLPDRPTRASRPPPRPSLPLAASAEAGRSVVETEKIPRIVRAPGVADSVWSIDPPWHLAAGPHPSRDVAPTARCPPSDQHPCETRMSGPSDFGNRVLARTLAGPRGGDTGIRQVVPDPLRCRWSVRCPSVGVPGPGMSPPRGRSPIDSSSSPAPSNHPRRKGSTPGHPDEEAAVIDRMSMQDRSWGASQFRPSYPPPASSAGDSGRDRVDPAVHFTF